MSSGYSSLEEDSEEYFFTARTSFFKKPSGKVTVSKVNMKYPLLLSI